MGIEAPHSLGEGIFVMFFAAGDQIIFKSRTQQTRANQDSEDNSHE